MSRAVAATVSPRSSAAIAHSRPKPREQPVMNQIFCVMCSTLGLECTPGQGRRLSSATHSTWWVIGNRSKARSRVQPVAVLGEDRDVAGQRGRVAGDVGHGAGRAVDDLLHDRPLGALAGRVEDDEVERLVVRRREHPVDAARTRRPRLVAGQVARRVLGTPRGRPRRRRPGRPARPRRRGTRRTARRRRRGRAPTPPAAARASRAPSRPGPGAPRGAPARTRRRRPRSRAPEHRSRYGPGAARGASSDQAVVDGHHVVRAVLAHARAGRRAA